MDTNQTNQNSVPSQSASSSMGQTINKARDSKKWRMTIIIVLIVVAVTLYLW